MAKIPAVFFLSVYVFLFSWFTVSQCFAEVDGRNVPVTVASLPDMVLWEKAMGLLEEGKGDEAGAVLFKLRQLYPESVMAEDALWRAAQIMKTEALAAEEPDWSAVRAAFKRFSSDYPKSSHVEEAYLEIGITHCRMRYFREALVYLNLFFKRYPDAAIVDRAIFWKAKTLLEIGRIEESRKLLEGFPQDSPLALRLKAARLLAGLYFESGHYKQIFTLYDGLKKELAPYSKEDLNYLRLCGMSHLRLHEETKGRTLLYRYINVVEDTAYKNEVYFELAESYTRAGDRKTAKRLYERIIESGGESDREVILANFRLTEFKNDPTVKRPDWQRQADPANAAEDAVYLVVLENYQREPIAQEVRYGLLLRYLARNDFEEALRIGKSYLKNTGDEDQAGRDGKAGIVLLKLEEELFKRGEYQKVYDLYKQYYKYIEKLASGHLLSLVGQSLEQLGLLEQAAVVYYRSLGLSLQDEEKTDIYFRRASLYLRIKDYNSARRLLVFLQRIYKGLPEYGEVCYLSGRLRAATGVPDEAVEFYQKAVSMPVSSEKKALYVDAHLQLLFKLDRITSFAEALGKYGKEKWLSLARLQYWYSRLGDHYRQQGKLLEAKDAYLAGLAAGMPSDGAVAQEIHFFLGDIFLKEGDEKAGKQHLESVMAGPEKLWQELADRRLQEEIIDQAVLELAPFVSKER